MKLWLLWWNESTAATTYAWEEATGAKEPYFMLVRADSEAAGGRFAHDHAHYEHDLWLQPTYSFCQEVHVSGLPGVLVDSETYEWNEEIF